MAGDFSFDDFLQSSKMMRKMGPLQGVISMVPGLGKQLKGVDLDERELDRVGGDHPLDDPRRAAPTGLIDGSRRKRIAAGSGTSVQQVNQLLNARKQMAKMMKQMSKGKLPGSAHAQAWPGTDERHDQASRAREEASTHGGT